MSFHHHSNNLNGLAKLQLSNPPSPRHDDHSPKSDSPRPLTPNSRQSIPHRPTPRHSGHSPSSSHDRENHFDQQKNQQQQQESIGNNKGSDLSAAASVCASCNATKTSQWRRDADGRQICNACGKQSSSLRIPLILFSASMIPGVHPTRAVCDQPVPPCFSVSSRFLDRFTFLLPRLYGSSDYRADPCPLHRVRRAFLVL